MKLNRLQLIPTIALISSIGFLILLLPGWNMTESTKERIDEDRLTMNQLNQLTERSSDLTNRTTELQGQLDRINKQFLTSTSALEFITTLEQTASTHQVEMKLQKFDPPQAKSTSSVIELTASGSLDSLLSFMHEIESLPWLVTFDSTSLALAATADRSVNAAVNTSSIVLNLTGRTYWLPTPNN
jgi:Tfp pilus assembly protein PilO